MKNTPMSSREPGFNNDCGRNESLADAEFLVYRFKTKSRPPKNAISSTPITRSKTMSLYSFIFSLPFKIAEIPAITCFNCFRGDWVKTYNHITRGYGDWLPTQLKDLNTIERFKRFTGLKIKTRLRNLANFLIV